MLLASEVASCVRHILFTYPDYRGVEHDVALGEEISVLQRLLKIGIGKKRPVSKTGHRHTL